MKLTKELVKAGQHIWVAYLNKPVELIIADGVIHRSNAIQVFVGGNDKYYTSLHSSEDKNALGLYLGDEGVPGFAYDGRECQVFLTKEALLEAMAFWNGLEPNFIVNGVYQEPERDFDYLYCGGED